MSSFLLTKPIMCAILLCMKKILVGFFALFFASGNLAIAADPITSTGCQNIYGGGDSCVQSKDFSLNKTVKNPLSNEYIDNLSSGAAQYAPGQQVPFKIVIKNTSKKDLTNIMVKDTFPKYIDFQLGSGKYDPKTRTFSFSINKLAPNESRVYFISGMVVAKDKLPSDKDLTCVINQVSGTASKSVSRDNSQFCLSKNPKTTGSAKTTPAVTNPPTTKGGLPVYPPTQTKQTPPTGPETLALFGLIPASALGFWLRKKTK